MGAFNSLKKKSKPKPHKRVALPRSITLSFGSLKLNPSESRQAVNTKRCLKNVKRNEGVVVVTYSTMSCFGLPVSGVQLTDHSWPSADRKKTPSRRERAAGGRGPGERPGSLHKQAAQLPPGAFLPLYLPTSLRVSCHIFFSC